MTIAREILKELLGMFLTDARLTAATLLLVALVGGLAAMQFEPLLAGGVLLLGCLTIVAATASHEARTRADR